MSDFYKETLTHTIPLQTHKTGVHANLGKSTFKWMSSDVVDFNSVIHWVSVGPPASWGLS